MKLASSALCLVLAFANIAAATAADVLSNVSWQKPIEGCMNSWVSNGTWSVRVTDVRNLTDRYDVSVTWRSDAKKTLHPLGATDAGFHGFSIEYGGDDSLGMLDTTSGHPERNELGDDLLMHRFTPGATYSTVLHFYYPEVYSEKAGHNVVAPRKQNPIAFLADTVIAPTQRCTTGCLSPIRIKLNCTK
jgi:hypothetical protein